MAPREELEKPYRSINSRTSLTRLSPVVHHSRPPSLAAEQTIVLIVTDAHSDTTETTPL
ncbi:hypothetical protein [Saccharothrix stipae]